MVRKLRKWLRAKGWTQTELAAALDYAQPTISLVLSGSRPPGAELRGRLEQITGLPAAGWKNARRARAT